MATLKLPLICSSQSREFDGCGVSVCDAVDSDVPKEGTSWLAMIRLPPLSASSGGCARPGGILEAGSTVGAELVPVTGPAGPACSAGAPGSGCRPLLLAARGVLLGPPPAGPRQMCSPHVGHGHTLHNGHWRGAASALSSAATSGCPSGTAVCCQGPPTRGRYRLSRMSRRQATSEPSFTRDYRNDGEIGSASAYIQHSPIARAGETCQ